MRFLTNDNVLHACVNENKFHICTYFSMKFSIGYASMKAMTGVGEKVDIVTVTLKLSAVSFNGLLRVGQMV